MYNLYTPHEVKKNLKHFSINLFDVQNQFFIIRLNKFGTRRFCLPNQTFDGKGLNKILPPREVMKILRISRFTLRKMVNSKYLTRYKTHENGYFYKTNEIIKFIKQGGIQKI
jgi:hypothetical protein